MKKITIILEDESEALLNTAIKSLNLSKLEKKYFKSYLINQAIVKLLK